MASQEQTDSNILKIRSMIFKKIQNKPYHATVADVKDVISNIDHYPYTRFFKGDYKSSEPVVAARQAGYVPNHHQAPYIVSGHAFRK
jgi:hypothetical protein